MNFRNELPTMKKKIGDVCFIDFAITHTILQDKNIS